MEAYPPELTSPPVPLVALIGPSEVQKAVGDYLRSQHAPRMHSIGIADPHSAAGTFGAKKGAVSAAPPAGILKAGWLQKHRSTRPAVAAVFLEREAVAGDPSSWAWLVAQLDAVRAAARPRGMRVLVVVLLRQAGQEVPEDRAAMLARQAGIDKRCVLGFAPSEGTPALLALGRVLHEQACLFYTADAQRRLAAHAQRNVPSVDLNARVAFKLGALAEFRGDWGSALTMYKEAYSYAPQLLSGMGAGGSTSLPVQRYVEVCSFTEQAHVKVLSLLLLALKQLPDAVAQYETHIRLFRRIPFDGLPGIASSHYAFLSRQAVVMAALLASCGADLAALRAEQRPPQLYLAAAQSAVARRKAASELRQTRRTSQPVTVGKVVPGEYVGQVQLAAPPPHRLSDSEFEQHLEAEEVAAPLSEGVIALLLTAIDALNRQGLRPSGKLALQASALLAEEHLAAGDASAACRLATEVAAHYRRERWQGPLLGLLRLLRNCAQRMGDTQAQLLADLEAAALDKTLDTTQRAALASTAALPLLGQVHPQCSPRAAAASLPPPSGPPAPAAAAGSQQQYEVATLDSGWLTVLPLCVGFIKPPAHASASGSSSGGLWFAAALWNALPVELPLTAAEVELRDAQGTFTLNLLPTATSTPAASSGAGEGEAACVPLRPGSWQRLAARLAVRCSGQLQAVAVTLHLGGAAGSSLRYQLAPLLQQQQLRQAASQQQAGLVGWIPAGWEGLCLPFSAAAGFLPGSISVDVPPRHQPPHLSLSAPEALLKGEAAAVMVSVTAGTDALSGMQVAVTAIARDTQQPLPLAADASSSSPQQQPQGDGVWSLTDMTAGQGSTLKLLLSASQQGQVDISAMLTYSASLAGGSTNTSSSTNGGAAGNGSTCTEAGTATATLLVPVEAPWRLDVQLLGPPHTHSLLGPPTGGAGGVTIGPTASDAAEMVQGLRLTDSTVSLSAESSGGGSGTGAGTLPPPLVTSPSEGGGGALTAHLPARYVLPASQACTAVVQLASASPAPLEVLGVELLLPGTSSYAASADGVASATTGPALRVDSALPPVEGSGLPVLQRGDVHTALFSIRAAAAGEAPSLGALLVRWRRHMAPTQCMVAASTGSIGSDAEPLAADGPVSEPQPAVETVVPLPGASFRPAVLSVETCYASGATAGEALGLAVRLLNSSTVPQEVSVAVGDPHGFALAGPKSTRLNVPPNGSLAASWQAVPYHTGFMQLPEVVVSSERHGQRVEATRGCSVFVDRAL